MLLMGSLPPPLDPPLDFLTRNPVPTDPRKQVWAFEEAGPGEESVLRVIWDADDPLVLEAELRAPLYGQRLPKEDVPKFWKAVKERVSVLGPLPVEGADPRP